MSDYTDLQAKVVSWTHRDDLGPLMDDFTLLSEAMIGEELMSQSNQVALPTAFIGKTYDLPDNYIRMVSVVLSKDDAEVPIEQVSLQQLNTLQSRTGSPIAYAIHSGVIEFSNEITVQEDGEIIYYSQLDSLIDNGTNAVLTKYPLLYLAAMLFYAFQYEQDTENADKWVSVYNAQIKQINKSRNSYVLPRVR